MKKDQPVGTPEDECALEELEQVSGGPILVHIDTLAGDVTSGTRPSIVPALPTSFDFSI